MYRDGTVRGGDGSRGAGSEGASSDPPTPAPDGLESISRDDFPLPTASAIESPARDPEPKPENSDSLKPHPERDAIHPTLSPLDLFGIGRAGAALFTKGWKEALEGAAQVGVPNAAEWALNEGKELPEKAVDGVTHSAKEIVENPERALGLPEVPRTPPQE